MAKIRNTDVAEKDVFADLRKSAEKSLEVLKEMERVLKENLTQQKNFAKGFKATNVSDIKKLAAAQNEVKKSVAGLNEIEKEKIRLEATLKKLNSDKIQQNEELKVLIAEQRKSNRELAKDSINLGNAYQKLTRQTNKAQAEFKRLAAQFGVNSKEARGAKKEFDRLDSQLRQVNNAARDGRRDVGRYGTAFSKLGGILKSGLGFIGITSAIGLISSAFVGASETVRKFDESIADLRKTTGLSDKSARDLAKSLTTIDTRSSVFELVELATAAGRLGIAEKDIKDFVEQADKLFVALGDDLGGTAEEIATSIGKISSVFGVEGTEGVGEGLNKIGSVINELAGSTKANAGNILDFTNRLAGIAPASKISVQNVAGLAATLDSFGQSMEVGSSALAKLIPEIGKDLPKFAKLAGVSVEEFSKILNTDGNEALLRVLEGAKSTKGGIEGLTQTLGNLGVDSARAAGVVGVLSNNIDEVRKNQKLANEAFYEGVSLTNEFNIKNQTLDASIDKLSNSYDNLILSFESGDGVLSDLARRITDVGSRFLDFIADVNKSGGAFNAVKKLALDTAIAFGFVEDGMRNAGIAFIEHRAVFDELTKRLKEGKITAEQYKKAIDLLVSGYKRKEDVEDKNNKTTDVVIEKTRRTVAVIEAEIDALQKLIKEQTNRKGAKAIQDKIKLLEKEREAILGNNKGYKERNETLNKEREEYRKLQAEIEKINVTKLKEQEINDESIKKLKEREDRAAFEREMQRQLDLENERVRLEKQVELREKSIDILEAINDKYFEDQNEKADKQISETEKREKRLQELADKGIQDARDSLAQNQKEQAEAVKKKEELRQQEKKTELALAVLKAFNAELEKGAGPSTAFAKAIASSAVLVSAISALPAFFDGTENTGNNGKGVDGKGGFLSILHPNERVVPKVINDKLDGISNEKLGELADNGLLSYALNSQNMGVKYSENSKITKELTKLQELNKSIIKAIESRPIDEGWTVDDIKKVATHTVRIGSKREKTKFKL